MAWSIPFPRSTSRYVGRRACSRCSALAGNLRPQLRRCFFFFFLARSRPMSTWTLAPMRRKIPMRVSAALSISERPCCLLTAPAFSVSPAAAPEDDGPLDSSSKTVLDIVHFFRAYSSPSWHKRGPVLLTLLPPRMRRRPRRSTRMGQEGKWRDERGAGTALGPSFFLLTLHALALLGIAGLQGRRQGVHEGKRVVIAARGRRDADAVRVSRCVQSASSSISRRTSRMRWKVSADDD